MSPVVATEVKADDQYNIKSPLEDMLRLGRHYALTNVLLGWPYPSALPSGKTHPQRVYDCM